MTGTADVGVGAPRIHQPEVAPDSGGPGRTARPGALAGLLSPAEAAGASYIGCLNL